MQDGRQNMSESETGYGAGASRAAESNYAAATASSRAPTMTGTVMSYSAPVRSGRGRHTLNLEDGGQFISTMLCDPATVKLLNETSSDCRVKYGLSAFGGGFNPAFATNRPVVTVNKAGKPLPRNHLNQVLGSVKPSQFMPCLEQCLRRRDPSGQMKGKYTPNRKFLLKHMRVLGRGESRTTGRNSNAVGVARLGGMGNYFTNLADKTGKQCSARDLDLAVGDVLYLTLPKEQQLSNGAIVYAADEYMFTNVHPLGTAAEWGRHHLSPLTQWVLEHIEGIMRSPLAQEMATAVANGLMPDPDTVKSLRKMAFAFGDDVVRLPADFDAAFEVSLLTSMDDLYEVLKDETIKKIRMIGKQASAYDPKPQMRPIHLTEDTLALVDGTPAMMADDYFAAAIMKARQSASPNAFAVQIAAYAETGALDFTLGIDPSIGDADAIAHLRESRIMGHLAVGRVPFYGAFWSMHEHSGAAVENELRSVSHKDSDDLIVGLFLREEEDSSITVLHARTG